MEDNIVLDVPSTEEKAQHYTAMGHSIDLIYAVMSERTQWLKND
jgi:hypothetical protein